MPHVAHTDISGASTRHNVTMLTNWNPEAKKLVSPPNHSSLVAQLDRPQKKRLAERGPEPGPQGLELTDTKRSAGVPRVF